MRKIKPGTTKPLPDLPDYLNTNYNRIAKVIVENNLYQFQERTYNKIRSLNTSFSKALSNEGRYVSINLYNAVLDAIAIESQEILKKIAGEDNDKSTSILNFRVNEGNHSLQGSINSLRQYIKQKTKYDTGSLMELYNSLFKKPDNNIAIKEKIFNHYRNSQHIHIYCLNSALENKLLKETEIELIQFKNLTLSFIFYMIKMLMEGYKNASHRLYYHLTNREQAVSIWKNLAQLTADYIDANEYLGVNSLWIKLIRYFKRPFKSKTELIIIVLQELNTNGNIKIYFEQQRILPYPTLIFDPETEHPAMFHISGINADKSYKFTQTPSITITDWYRNFKNLKSHEKEEIKYQLNQTKPNSELLKPKTTQQNNNTIINEIANQGTVVKTELANIPESEEEAKKYYSIALESQRRAKLYTQQLKSKKESPKGKIRQDNYCTSVSIPLGNGLIENVKTSRGELNGYAIVTGVAAHTNQTNEEHRLNNGQRNSALIEREKISPSTQGLSYFGKAKFELINDDEGNEVAGISTLKTKLLSDKE